MCPLLTQRDFPSTGIAQPKWCCAISCSPPGHKVLGFSLPCLRQQEGVGPPRKYLPRKKIPANLRSLARGHTELCIRVLAGIVSQEAVPSAARVSAAGILLDRGWGKPAQPHAGEEGKDIKITIRKMIGGDED